MQREELPSVSQCNVKVPALNRVVNPQRGYLLYRQRDAAC
jgi:hypothetical protein